jgi:hypothetical protein
MKLSEKEEQRLPSALYPCQEMLFYSTVDCDHYTQYLASPSEWSRSVPGSIRAFTYTARFLLILYTSMAVIASGFLIRKACLGGREGSEGGEDGKSWVPAWVKLALAMTVRFLPL